MCLALATFANFWIWLIGRLRNTLSLYFFVPTNYKHLYFWNFWRQEINQTEMDESNLIYQLKSWEIEENTILVLLCTFQIQAFVFLKFVEGGNQTDRNGSQLDLHQFSICITNLYTSKIHGSLWSWLLGEPLSNINIHRDLFQVKFK